MKLILKNDANGVWLCDEMGNALPGQEAIELFAEPAEERGKIKSIKRFYARVKFHIDGEQIKLQDGSETA